MKLIAIAAILLSASGHLYAQNLSVKDAWARASVPGQKASGVFMQLTAQQASRLVGVSSPAAAVAEVHEMKMEGDVMRMRALGQGLELPAGTPVALRPGGYHIMLMDLKAPLQAGSTLALTLRLQDAQGAISEQVLSLPVLASAPASMPAHGQAHSPAPHGGPASPKH